MASLQLWPLALISLGLVSFAYLVIGSSGQAVRTLTQRAALHTEPTARCTRLAYDDTRIVTGALSGKIAVLDFL